MYDAINSKVNDGNLSGALQDVNSAFDKYGPNNVEWNWRFRVLKAQILISQAKPKEALVLLSNEFPNVISGKDVFARKLLFEGIAYRTLQDFDSSQKKLDEAEHIAESAYPLLLSQILNARGALEVDLNQLAKAEATFRKALLLARQDKIPRQEASAVGNLARLATSQEHFDEAIDLSQSALELSKTLGMQGTTSAILGNTAWSYFQLGSYDDSFEYYTQAAESSEKAGLFGYELYWRTGVANSYIARHDDKSAEPILKKTLQRAQGLNNAQTIVECLNALSGIMLRAGRLDEAAEFNQRALETQKAGDDHFGILESRLIAGRIESSRKHFDEAEKLFRQSLEDPKADTQWKWQAEAYLAELHDQQGKVAEAEKEYKNAIGTIEAARSSVSRDDLRLSFLSGAIEFYDGYVDFLIRHKRPEDALKVADLSRARTLAEGLSTEAARNAKKVANVQPQTLARQFHSILMFYWLGRKNSYLWVVTPSKTTYFTLPSEMALDGLVRPYAEEAAKSRDVFLSERGAGQRLYETLVQPAKALIPKDSRVILFPDGSLYGLNFETLIVPDLAPHFWIEDMTLTTASSLSLLAEATEKQVTRQRRLLLVGNSVPTNSNFVILPQAGEEMRKVAEYFPEPHRDILSGAQATPSAYLASHPEQFEYLHFVTHGTASRTRPLESAVVLSKEPGGDSYKLYARDIVAHRLKADLVTISACNGSGTRAYSGEGLVGLSWAFLRAGAHNVIGALWEVSDSSTPRLMDELYGELAKGRDPASALRTAKLSLLHSKDVYRKPFYWAPFQLYTGS